MITIGTFGNYKFFNLLKVCNFIQQLETSTKPVMKWIQHSQMKKFEEVAKGRFSVIYKATWLDNETFKAVAVKRFSNSQHFSKYFLNEVILCSVFFFHFIFTKLNWHELHRLRNQLETHCDCRKFYHVIRCYGITKDPKTNDYMLVMKYADGGSLYDYLQKNFINLTWEKKVVDPSANFGWVNYVFFFYMVFNISNI